ncbi:PepSY domain-containing protein [uncultured Cedecea sp.]|uniref:PepSY-associated TM helix domain-containing protein n=1 Tax=uncultured Cedecea sp. TaxID=988762 RepID=UPI002617ECF9|nr:PepSY-associated TM helix domain-containing protein [uncultured Cedecea sp.]
MPEKNITQRNTRAATLEFFRRLHFYIGLFVGPFIFIAALTGALYVSSIQIEKILYAYELKVEPTGEPKSLSQQIDAARRYAGQNETIYAVRPAPGPADSTRVQFVDANLGASESSAVFVDPYTLQILGSHTVYGSSGSLPLRMWIDQIHRGLLLGDFGRNYSELAASWMWVAAVGGIFLWWSSRPKRQRRKPRGGLAASRRLHITLGLFLLAGLLLFSATGLTWSQWAGGNIDSMRAAFNWLTPQVRTTLEVPAAHHHQAHDPHAEHHMPVSPSVLNNPDNALWENVLAAARLAGVDANNVEIRAPKTANHAWTVSEREAHWPSQVDVVAIDPHNMQLVDKVSFEQYPLAAKLTRWGIDFHMGLLFGLPNQILLIAFGLGVCVMIVLGYRMWWLRRPAAPTPQAASTLIHAWINLSPGLKMFSLFIPLVLGFCLPVMGISLLIFIFIDLLRWQRQKRRITR